MCANKKIIIRSTITNLISNYLRINVILMALRLRGSISFSDSSHLERASHKFTKKEFISVIVCSKIVIEFIDRAKKIGTKTKNKQVTKKRFQSGKDFDTMNNAQLSRSTLE